MKATNSASTIVTKFHDLETGVGGETYEMEEPIHGGSLALASGTHIFFHGPPGVAKSYLVDRTVQRIANNRHFHILFHPFTIQPDLEGPEDLMGLKDGHRRRLTDGYMPWCFTMFGDEIWRAGPAVLATQLTATQERKHRNDGEMRPIPLSTGWFASNSLPDDEDLLAAYDRMHQRYWIDAIKDPEAFVDMLLLQEVEHPEPVMDWADVVKAKEMTKKVTVSRAIAEAIKDVRFELLENHNIIPSPRRYRQSVDIARAEAFLRGGDEVLLEDLEVLAHVVPENKEQQELISKILIARCNPHHQEVLELVHDWSELAAMVDETKKIDTSGQAGKARQAQATTELTTKLNEGLGELKTVLAKPLSNRARNSALKGRTILVQAYRRTLVELHNLPEAMIDAQLASLGMGEVKK
jgi:MoxR-like ATPase